MLPADTEGRLLDQLVDAAERPGRVRDVGKMVDLEEMNTAAENAENFICGLLLLEDEQESEKGFAWSARVQKRVFDPRRSRGINTKGHGYLISLIAVRPILIAGIDPVLRLRIDQLFAATYRGLQTLPGMEASRHPAQLLQAMLSEPATRDILADFPMTVETIIDEFWHDNSTADVLLDAKLGTRLVAIVVTYLETCDRKGEEIVSGFLRRYDARIAPLIDAYQAVGLFESLGHSRLSGAAAELRKGEYFALPALRSLARKYIVEHIPARLDDFGLTKEPLKLSGFDRVFLRYRGNDQAKGARRG
jgi:hypothetical protein